MADPIVHAIATTQGHNSFSVHAREFFMGMSRCLPLMCSQWIRKFGAESQARVFQDRELVQRYFPGRPIVSISLNVASEFDILYAAPGPRIGFTVWDPNLIPESWVEPLSKIDRIWVPSQWGRRVLGANGIDTHKIDVMPEGVDSSIFHPNGPAIANIAALPGFKFITVGKYEERKATGEMIKAFDDEFAGKPNVWFVISCHNPYDKTLNLRDEIRALNLKDPSRLMFIPVLPTHRDLAKLYRSCDAFVGASRAEGWGLCHMEGAACGLPLITTNYSAPSEWAAGHAYFIDHGMTKVKTSFFYRRDGDQGSWADPDWSQFRRAMRHLVNNPEEAKQRGQAISEHVRKNYDWSVTAARGAELVRQIVAS
ncbi:MAG: glycosyltransferase family 4 protein [Alphaproteobacteria bacterium]|nr:glycosyltransferase family 4 protein [Alphaproteobacteria bacterium]